MWMVNPRVLCTKHLGGEHVETHMFLGCVRRRKKLSGFLQKGLIEPLELKRRHDALAEELLRRKRLKSRGEVLQHNSPLVLTSEEGKYLEELDRQDRKKVSEMDSLFELIRRCPNCRRNICF